MEDNETLRAKHNAMTNEDEERAKRRAENIRRNISHMEDGIEYFRLRLPWLKNMAQRIEANRTIKVFENAIRSERETRERTIQR
jgi:hypothetical protein